MRGGQDDARAPWALGLERQVQFARGQWRREEEAGAIRSAGWWESVTVTWSPAAASRQRSPLLHRTLATAWEAIAPSLAGLAAEGTRRLIERRYGTRAILSSPRRPLPASRRALPRTGRAR